MLKKLLTITIVICLAFLFQSYKVDVKTKKINQILVNFFLNLELTKRNQEIQGIYDYIPHLNSDDKIENIVFNSILKNGFIENITFDYHKNVLSKIEYQIKRDEIENHIIFKYHFNYSNDKLNSVYIKNRLLYKFNYNSSGVLKEIKYFRKDQVTEVYNVLYYYDNQMIKFSSDIIKNDDVYFNVNESKDFLIWNKDLKIKKFSFDIFSYENITYLNSKNIETITYSTTIDQNLLFTWLYIQFDKRNNWTERKSKGYTSYRIINYK